jgi:hypothetical protein
VHLGSDASGHRRVREIVAVPGRVEREVIETSDIFVTRGGRLERADGYPPHPDRFEAAGIDLISALGIAPTALPTGSGRTRWGRADVGTELAAGPRSVLIRLDDGAA